MRGCGVSVCLLAEEAERVIKSGCRFLGILWGV